MSKPTTQFPIKRAFSWCFPLLFVSLQTAISIAEESLWVDTTPQSIRSEILKRKFQGEWILYPNQEFDASPLSLGVVLIPTIREDWGFESLLSSLTPIQTNGYFVYSAYVRMEDTTGATEFFAEAPTSTEIPLLSVGGQSTGYDPWWVARVFQFDPSEWDLSSLTEDDPRRALLCSTLGYTLWFVAESDAKAFLASLAPSPPRRAPRRGPPRRDPDAPFLHFDSIDVQPNNITLEASWNPSNLPGGALDLFCQTNLLQRTWEKILTVPVATTATNVSFVLDETVCSTEWADLLFHGTRIASGVTTTTNAPSLPSDFPPEFANDYIPNAIITTTNYTNTGTSAAFFRLGTQHDSNTNGLTDAYEILVTQTDPEDPDTDGDGFYDGWEVAHGFNPLSDNATDSDPTNDRNADPDNDGLTNWSRIQGASAILFLREVLIVLATEKEASLQTTCLQT